MDRNSTYSEIITRENLSNWHSAAIFNMINFFLCIIQAIFARKIPAAYHYISMGNS